MGGNTLAFDKRSKVYTRADNINLEIIGVNRFRDGVTSLVLELNKAFKEIHEKDLFDVNNYREKTFKFFGGSSSLVMNPGYDEKSVLRIKKDIGDIDIFIRVTDFVDFCKLLDKFEGLNVTERVKYKGYNRRNTLGLLNQRHCIFEFDFGTGLIFNFQIDFIGVPFTSGLPNYFTRFVNVTMTQDLKSGFKGLAKNVLIECLFTLKYGLDDVIVVNAGSTPDNYRVRRKINSICLYEFRNDLGAIKKYEKFMNGSEQIFIDGKAAYIELPLDKKNTISSVKDIYELLFDRDYSKNQKAFRSFKEFVPLLRGLLTREEVHKLNSIFVKKFWDDCIIYRCSNEPVQDNEVKTQIYEYFIKTLNLKDISTDLKQAFYAYF